MQSAEQSGVGAGRLDSRSPRPNTLTQALRERFASLSPLSYALVLTAVLSAGLFVVADAVRTLEEVELRNGVVERLAAAQPLLSRQFTTTSLGPVLGETDPSAALLQVAQRGAVAFALAFIFIGFGTRRRTAPVASASTKISPLADLLSTIPFGVACWSSEGRLMVCNEQYRARLNAEPKDFRAGASYAASLRRLTEGGYMQLVREDEHSRILELHREDGSCLLIDERPLAGGGFVTLVTDVTESRRTDDLLVSIREEQRVLARRYHEEKLRAEAASRSKTSFLAHLSHDIRTPLNHIIGFADLMRHETYGPVGDPRYVEYVETIRNSGERLLSFFASILDLAELEGGRRILEENEIRVDDLLSASIRRYSEIARRKGLGVALGAPCGALLKGDRFSLERMLGNLIENAIRFTPAGGRVTLAAYAASDGVVLEITDTGIGMGIEQLGTLSQPFAFGDASLTKDRGGAGLGLAIARTIAELSGGRLAIDSRPGLGTTVAVSLPLHASEAVRAAA
jgi:two-component system cell cycle sensor histidine kinase PleC